MPLLGFWRKFAREQPADDREQGGDFGFAREVTIFNFHFPAFFTPIDGSRFKREYPRPHPAGGPDDAARFTRYATVAVKPRKMHVVGRPLNIKAGMAAFGLAGKKLGVPPVALTK